MAVGAGIASFTDIESTICEELRESLERAFNQHPRMRLLFEAKEYGELVGELGRLGYACAALRLDLCLPYGMSR